MHWSACWRKSDEFLKLRAEKGVDGTAAVLGGGGSVQRVDALQPKPRGS
jgi:hypothetical protein